jgi:hypothetical protein
MDVKGYVEKLKSLKRRLAVWEAMHRLMDDRFIGKDSKGKVGGIKEPETGDIVSESEIEDVLRTIAEGPITELRTEIASLESSEVVILGSTNKAPPPTS